MTYIAQFKDTSVPKLLTYFIKYFKIINKYMIIIK